MTPPTILIIAHRLATIQSAEKIIVLRGDAKNATTVAGVGTHTELMQNNSIYRELVTMLNEDNASVVNTSHPTLTQMSDRIFMFEQVQFLISNKFYINSNLLFV